MAAVTIEHSEIAESVRDTYAWAGDDGRLAHRLIIINGGTSQPIPLPFVREGDALRAAMTLKRAVEQGSVPTEWEDLRKMLLEDLAW